MDDLGFLSTLLSIPSHSGEEAAVAAFLEERMTALGFRVHRDEVGNVIGEIGDPHAEKTLVLLGHMDTVPGRIPVRWEGGRLFGRGAVDAKGPLGAFVVAAARVGPDLSGVRVLVIGAVDEEARSRGARHLAHTFPQPAWAIIGEPSGWNGITLGYKGALTVRYQRLRPTAHAASPRPRPAEEAIRFWNQLSAYAEHVNQGQAWGFHTLDPILRAIHTSSDGLCDGVEMELCVRLPPQTSPIAGKRSAPLGLTPSKVQTVVAGLANGAEISFPYLEHPFVADRDTPLVRIFLRAIRAAGGQPRLKLKTGTSDMNVVGPTWGCPILAYGPGDSSLDHAPDEHIEIEEFLQGVGVLTQVLSSLTGSLADTPAQGVEPRSNPIRVLGSAAGRAQAGDPEPPLDPAQSEREEEHHREVD